jgi:predicted ATPase
MVDGPRITRLLLHHYKGFRRFSIAFKGSSYLVGPNNAGKSTIAEALRACAQMLRYAAQRKPTGYWRDKGGQIPGYPIDADQFGLVSENLRHEFRPEEVRVELTFSNGSRLTAIWPEPDEEENGDQEGFFYLRLKDGRSPLGPAEVRRTFPRIGVVPLLGPLEQQERVLSDEHIRRNLDTELASRHFRNQLYWFGRGDDEFDLEYRQVVERWLPEIQLEQLELRGTGSLDLYYTEKESRVPKEICWSGDGLQVWLQLLMHLRRTEDCSVVVLDEPDAFLHPDLQRRLVRLLEALDSQTIMASHAPEVLLEANSDDVLWISRDQKAALRAPDESTLVELEGALGSQFNIRAARALKYPSVLFVEGQDMKILRSLAASTGATRVAQERELTIVPIGGFDNWTQVEAFGWLVKRMLGGGIRAYVILDRDYKSNVVCTKLLTRLSKQGIRGHIWARKELESYLLAPSLIARVSGASLEQVENILASISDDLRPEVEARVQVEWHREHASRDENFVTLAESFKRDFATRWDKGESVLMCPAKSVLSKLSEQLRAQGFRGVSARALAKQARVEELDSELRSVLREVEDL